MFLFLCLSADSFLRVKVPLLEDSYGNTVGSMDDCCSGDSIQFHEFGLLFLCFPLSGFDFESALCFLVCLENKNNNTDQLGRLHENLI